MLDARGLKKHDLVTICHIRGDRRYSAHAVREVKTISTTFAGRAHVVVVECGKRWAACDLVPSPEGARPCPECARRIERQAS